MPDMQNIVERQPKACPASNIAKAQSHVRLSNRQPNCRRIGFLGRTRLDWGVARAYAGWRHEKSEFHRPMGANVPDFRSLYNKMVKLHGSEGV